MNGALRAKPDMMVADKTFKKLNSSIAPLHFPSKANSSSGEGLWDSFSAASAGRNKVKSTNKRTVSV